MRWWCPSDEILVKAVHVALKALTADVADAAVAPAEAGSGSTAGGSPLAAEPAEDASEDCPDAGAVPEWREGLEDAARDAGLRGWLLVGFPRSAAQAAALEKLLTGWAPRTPAASPWTTFDASATDARWAQVCAPVDEEAAVARPDHALKQHSPRGVLTTLRLDTDAFRAARYALGWRADPVMQAMPAVAEGEDAPLASTARLPPRQPGVLAPDAPDGEHDTTAAPPRPPSASARPPSAARREPDTAMEGRDWPAEASSPSPPAAGPITGLGNLRPLSASGRDADGTLVPASARDRPSALPLDLPAHRGGGASSEVAGPVAAGEQHSQPGPRPWVWSPRTERPVTAEAGGRADASAGGGDLLGDEVRAAAFSTGYIPTLRSGPPLYHVDVLPPPYALDHKGALERAAISSAAARSMEAALLRREAGAKEASADAWFERAGALRVLRWHNPVVESRAREELKRGEGSDRVRKRALADVAALDAEAASWAAARRDDDAQPRQSGDWVLLRGTSPSGGPDQQVVETESWAEFEAPGRCLWAVGRRDLLADHELFSAAARALAHGFRDGHERATRSAAAAAAEAARRAAAVESLRDAFKSFLKAAEGVLHDSPAPQEAGPGEAAGDESARAATDASPDADAPAPAEGAAESASPADHATAGGEAHGTEAHAQPAAAEVRRPDLQPPLLPAWLATWSSAQPADGSESGGSGSGDAATGELDRGSAEDVPADQAVASGGAEAAGVEGAEEATSAGSEAASAAVDGPAAASAPAGASTAATGEEAAEVEAVATIDSNDAVLEARRALAIASVSVGLRVPVLVLPSWSSQEQATRSAVALARAAASSILRRWEGATRAYGVTAETHAWRWGRELEAAASRSARVAGAFAQAMCSPFDGYDEALQRLHTALCRVPASSRSRPEVQAALEADVDAVAAGMRVAAGKRFAAASELAASVSVQGWADAALWSLTASALAIASAERRRLAEARAALLQYAILAGGAVPVGAAPDGAEAQHACAILRLAGTAGLSSLADALESGSTAAEAAEADAAGGGAAGKKKAAAAKDKAAAAKKKGAASGKDKKKGKGGAGGGGGEDDEGDEDEAVASAEVGVPVAADFAWRVGHLAPPVVLPQPVSCLLAAPSAEDSAAPEAGAPDAQGAVQAMVSACGEDESQLEADVQGRGAARVEAAAAASLALAVGALVRDAVGSLLPFEVPAAAPVPGPAVSARQLGGGSAVAEDAEEPASRSVAWGVASAAMAEAEAFAAAVVWDSGRLRRARARVGRALVKAEKRRTAAAAAARTAVAHVEAEAQAELDAAAAALAEAQAGGGKDKKKGGAASKKDKKQAAASGVELPDMAEVLLPLSSVLPVPPVPAAAALAAGLSVGEQELASLAGLDPVELGRAIVSGRAAAQLRAEARIPDSVLSALEAEARHSAGRLRVLRRALGRAAERIASLAVQNTQQAVATAEARLRGELSAIESARIELRRDVQLGRAPVAPLRVQSRLARSEELLLPQTGAGASALKSGGGSGLAAVAMPATRDAVVVKLKQLRSCKQVSVLAEAGVAREAPGTDGLTPSGFGVLVSALRAVAEHSGNPALMLPAAAAGDKQLEAAAAWNAVFEDAVPPERVCFGPDGAPLAEASLDTAECEPATASVADAAAGSTGDAGAREEAVDAQGSGLQADGAMVPVVPAGAWAPETEVVATLFRLAGAGKLGARWREAARGGALGAPLLQWVTQHRVRPDEWPAAAVQQAARGEPHWVDWRRLCTAALFSAPTEAAAAGARDASQPAAAAAAAPDAAVAARPRVAASGAVLSVVPSAGEVAEFAERLADACGVDAAGLDGAVEHPQHCDAFCGPEAACAGVRPWFEGHGLRALASAESAGGAAEARLLQRIADLGAVAACETPPPELADSEPRLTDGLGGWHHLPTPHPVLSAASAAAGARVKGMRLQAAADLATERRLTAEDAAHMTSDALDASLGRALYRLWTDSSGTTRWGRMVFTLRALASAPAPLGPELSSPQPESAAAPTPAAGAAPAPPAAEASTAGGQGALQASTAAVRAARDAGALHPDAVAIAEASCISAAVAAAAAAAEASAGKGGKGAKRK
uniref:Uncharacterized protein n=2 Tax=Cafeteria roenbergensis TaxID=33653 RepID=A0A7S0PE77_CAFRO